MLYAISWNYIPTKHPCELFSLHCYFVYSKSSQQLIKYNCILNPSRNVLSGSCFVCFDAYQLRTLYRIIFNYYMYQGNHQ